MALNQHREPACLTSNRAADHGFDCRAVRLEFAMKVELRTSAFGSISMPRKLKREQQSGMHHVLRFDRVETVAQVKLL
jgi:hypothetical protein